MAKNEITTHYKEIFVPASECDRLNDLLKCELCDIESGLTIRAFHAKFDDGACADFKVYTLEGRYYLDANLYDDENGVELCPSYDAAGYDNIDNTYEFDVGSTKYKVRIRRWVIEEGTCVHWFDPDLADDDDEMYDRRWKVISVMRNEDDETELQLAECDENGKLTGSESNVFALECEPYPVKTEVRVINAPRGNSEPVAVFPELDWDDEGLLCKAYSLHGIGGETGLFRSTVGEHPLVTDKETIAKVKEVAENTLGWCIEIVNPV